MLKFNAHLGFQFNELPFLQRIEAAAAAGFRAVEFPSPYEFDASLLADHLAQYRNAYSIIHHLHAYRVFVLVQFDIDPAGFRMPRDIGQGLL